MYTVQLEASPTTHQHKYLFTRFGKLGLIDIDVWEGASGASADTPRFDLKSNLVSNEKKTRLSPGQ